MTFSPDLPVTHLKGVGPKLAATLERLGIYRLVDLLLHLPYRYQDRTRITPAVDIVPGEAYLVQGQIINCQILFGKRRSLNVVVEDQTGRVSLRFFHFSKYQQANFKAAGYVRAFGEFRFFGRQLTSAHPEYELFDAEPSTIEGEYLPVYPATQGLAQSRLRRLQETLCAMPWPQDEGLPYSKLQFLHRPPAGIELAEIETIRQALAEDELTAYYLVMKGRALRRMQSNAPLLEQTSGRGRELLAHLGFKLTQAQARVTAEILNDLAKPVPMLRLVQGDVGSGKTVVAAFAAIRAAEHGCQTAVMAPTELLAEQHFINFSNWLAPLNISVVLLTGGLTAAEQRQRLAAVEQGDALVIIGTHALFQRRVVFNNLALSIVDEQHRFGVHQRMALQMKGDQGRQPHQLIMTATPIPRTLTMALYADMEVSVIDELPQGRQPITTHTVDAERRTEVAALMATNIARGQQGYWVCNLIDVSDEIDAMSLEALEPIVADSLRQVRYGILHGRMSSDEKTQIMARFKAGDIQLLLATTVVEVGVDVPNATHMVIENAERLGLAQLHQLRGRVGRGNLASHCYLLFSSGLSQAAKTRLHAMRDSQDGFYLAEQDLKLRGPGDVLGTRQSGEQSFRIADLTEHAHLISSAMQRGERMLTNLADPMEEARMRNLLLTWAPADDRQVNV